MKRLLVGHALALPPASAADPRQSRLAALWRPVRRSRLCRAHPDRQRNIGRLGLAWSLDLPGEQSLEATPLAVDGVLYFTGSFSDVYAVSVATGKLLWKHETEVWRHNPDKWHYIFPLNRGVAYDQGRVFVGATDGRLLALDAKTGRELWSVETVERSDRRTITGARACLQRQGDHRPGRRRFGFARLCHRL